MSVLITQLLVRHANLFWLLTWCFLGFGEICLVCRSVILSLLSYSILTGIIGRLFKLIAGIIEGFLCIDFPGLRVLILNYGHWSIKSLLALVVVARPIKHELLFIIQAWLLILVVIVVLIPLVRWVDGNPAIFIVGWWIWAEFGAFFRRRVLAYSHKTFLPTFLLFLWHRLIAIVLKLILAVLIK